jgi:hypothetical protein
VQDLADSAPFNLSGDVAPSKLGGKHLGVQFWHLVDRGEGESFPVLISISYRYIRRTFRALNFYVKF